MNQFFKNINIFLARKIHFFLEKFRKIEYILQEFLIFSKTYFKIFNFYETYKSREIFGEFYDLVEKFIKKLKNSLNRGLLKMAWKILKIFGENWLEFVEKCKIINIFWMFGKFLN